MRPAETRTGRTASAIILVQLGDRTLDKSADVGRIFGVGCQLQILLEVADGTLHAGPGVAERLHGREIPWQRPARVKESGQ